MNQILYTGNNKSHGPASLKSILKFFSICLIILGVIFIGEGSYSLSYNNKSAKESIDDTAPVISFEQEENNAIVTITHNRGVSIVKYHWNDEADTVVSGNSQSAVILDTISIPYGINTLHVTAIDVNNKTTESSFEYAYDGISIELSVVDNMYMSITASDVTGLYYIKYKWNSGEEITAYPEGEDNTTITQTTEIPTGLNTLSITAVNSENKTVTKTQDVKGVHPPKISVYIKDGYLIVTVTDEEGIASISHQTNENEATVLTLNGEKEYTYKDYIADKGDILITITATDIEGVSKTFNGKNY